MNKSYNLQWLEDEDLWYMTIHDPKEGIVFEGWYYTVDEALEDVRREADK